MLWLILMFVCWLIPTVIAVRTAKDDVAAAFILVVSIAALAIALGIGGVVGFMWAQ